MTKFNSAAEVRAFLKGKFPDPVKIKWFNNPFGGEGHFSVSLRDVPQGVSTVSSSGSGHGYSFGSSDGGVTAGKMTQLRNLLKETNATCTG
jgi:hypothetical protein